MKNIVIAALLATFIAEPAAAAGKDFYAGAKLGLNSISSGNSKAFGVLGGYVLDSDLAVELAYTDLGSIHDKISNDTVKFSILEIGAVASFPVSTTYFAFGKIGMAKMSESGLGLPRVNRISPTWGLGMHYNYIPSIEIRFGLDSYNFGDSFIWKRGSSILYSVSGLYKF